LVEIEKTATGVLEAEIGGGGGCDFHPHEKQQLCLGQKMARSRATHFQNTYC
jgi:hypothetical protein